MKKNIVFFNHYHNGDLFAVKYFMKHVMNCLPDREFKIVHRNSEEVLKDLNVEFSHIENYSFLNERDVFHESEDSIFINTWIANFITGLPFITNWGTYYKKMFSYIFAELSLRIGEDIPLLPMESYIPEIDYSYFKIPNDFNCDYDNTIIFSNGPVRSFQSSLAETDFIVSFLLENFPNKTIILTHKTNIEHENIIYTSDIIKKNDGEVLLENGYKTSDINEISYIADKKCKYIIGRNS